MRLKDASYIETLRTQDAKGGCRNLCFFHLQNVRRRSSTRPLGMQVLEKCLEAAPPGGVIHLALCGDKQGLIMRWKTRLKAYIDPGQLRPQRHNVQASKYHHLCLPISQTAMYVMPNANMVTMTDLPEQAAALSSSYVTAIVPSIRWPPCSYCYHC